MKSQRPSKKAGKKAGKKRPAAKAAVTKKTAKRATPKKRAAAKRSTSARARPVAVGAETSAPTPSTATAPITVHEALTIAIAFEHKVRDHYARGAAAIKDAQGAKVFASLAKEEQGHVDYLESRLAQESATGSVGTEQIKTALPAVEWVRDALARHRATASTRRVADQTEIELLKIAVKLEQEASGFYHNLVRRLPEADRDLFTPFLDIEDGHVAIVQAELDSVQGWGYWFDVPEFALEAQ